MLASVYACTRLGGDHTANQDRALVDATVLERTDGVTLTDLAAPTVLGVFDGLGGHAAGDVASELAARTVSDAALPADEAELAQLLHRADQVLMDAMREAPDRNGMGTTAALLVFPDDAGTPLTANVGDSTIWRLRDDGFEELSTSDRWLSSGVLQCLGATGEGIAPHVRRVELLPGDRVLVATDGLTDVVPPRVLGTTLQGDVREAAERLLAMVDEAGFPDDLTFVIVDVHG